ncbi:hypothetical protein [Verminephrobacter aporrectodeae]|uniref:hypothetical protein n=1 Tax=Verminephrobacter aporrectodeae TaxID=1110389 RepID=UPI002244E896|nr:hypothetical protein [Verminephrobacter aporrectodeae]
MPSIAPRLPNRQGLGRQPPHPAPLAWCSTQPPAGAGSRDKGTITHCRRTSCAATEHARINDQGIAATGKTIALAPSRAVVRSETLTPGTRRTRRRIARMK